MQECSVVERIRRVEGRERGEEATLVEWKLRVEWRCDGGASREQVS